MSNFDFYQNRECEYFPCHSDADPETFNCLFCYCPLYALGDRCGGDFVYTDAGIKDCSGCTRPHCRENYPQIQKQMSAVLELAKRKDAKRETP